jgi:ATP-binding cassette subfamily B protein
MIFAGLVSLLDMVNPKIISYTVDSVIGTKPSALPGGIERLIENVGGVSALRSHPIWIAAAVIVIGCLAALCRYIFRTMNTRGAETFVRKMRDDLFAHIMYLPYTWHSENSTGDIIQRCTSDVNTIKRFISEQLVQLFRTVIMIVLALFFMGRIHFRVMLGSALMIPVIVIYSLIFHVKIGTAFEKVDVEEGVLSSIVQENLTGVRVVRAFGREVYERGRFEKQNTYYTGFWIRLMTITSMYWSVADILTGLQILFIMLFGSVACIHGTLTVGGFIAMTSYNMMLIWPVRQLGRVISEMSKAGISIERLRYIMNSEIETDSKEAGEPPMDRDITFENVTYAYANAPSPVLKDVSLTIPAGSTFGILGGTGSGKSTLMYLLDHLYDLGPDGGRITIGGVDIANIKKDYLRRNIGMVLQEPFLFSRTLSENIGITGHEKNMDEIRRAAKIASIDDAIESFTSGYDTFVGERGVTLSGGQKQRTAIAQMLISKPPIMIFDDSLSAVDAETDMRIRRAIQENTGSSTVILIAHRITTLMNADHIIVLDKGKIREQGTHEELLAQNGLYRRIYDLQTAGIDDSEAGI